MAELCPKCGAYWQCDCEREPIIGTAKVLPLSWGEYGPERLVIVPRPTTEHLEAVRDEYRERYRGVT